MVLRTAGGVAAVTPRAPGRARRREPVAAAPAAGLPPRAEVKLSSVLPVPLQGHADCVLALADGGADLDVKTSKGNSAVAVAAKHRQWQTLGALLDRGATADARALLHTARKEGGKEMTRARERLCEAGALEGRAADSDGTSALMLAVSSGESAMVGRLLALKADPNAADAKGLTPLHYCADKGAPRPPRLVVVAAY